MIIIIVTLIIIVVVIIPQGIVEGAQVVFISPNPDFIIIIIINMIIITVGHC